MGGCQECAAPSGPAHSGCLWSPSRSASTSPSGHQRHLGEQPPQDAGEAERATCCTWRDGRSVRGRRPPRPTRGRLGVRDPPSPAPVLLGRASHGPGASMSLPRRWHVRPLSVAPATTDLKTQEGTSGRHLTRFYHFAGEGSEPQRGDVPSKSEAEPRPRHPRSERAVDASARCSRGMAEARPDAAKRGRP